MPLAAPLQNKAPSVLLGGSSMRLPLLAAATLAVTVGTACNTTSFRSESPKVNAKAPAKEDPKTPKKADATLKLACEDGKGEAHLVTDLKGTGETQVRLEGEFCGIEPTAANGKLTVLFGLDFSGSMKTNHPTVGDTSGRLGAANAIVSKLEADLHDGIDLNIGILPFGAAAEPLVAPQPLAAFKTQLTAATICRSDSGDTTYDAAFQGATEALKTVEGAKVVYFVSDGLPTSSGTGILTGIGTLGGLQAIYDAGKKAAEGLRALPDLTLNTIFLGSTTGIGTAGVDPQTYLEEITGDKDHVKVVQNAQDLAAAIVKFETPDPVTLEKDAASGIVDAGSLGKETIKLASLEADPDREGVWTFVTEPFALFGDAKKAVKNELTFLVKTADGKEYKATAEVSFQVEAE
jgi:hypothetical protein